MHPSIAVLSNHVLNTGYCKTNSHSVSLYQINHKYPERRLLVAESCGALAPYLPVSINTDSKYSATEINCCIMQPFIMLNIPKSSLYHSCEIQ